jgi:hypothetical protein
MKIHFVPTLLLIVSAMALCAHSTPHSQSQSPPPCTFVVGVPKSALKSGEVWAATLNEALNRTCSSPSIFSSTICMGHGNYTDDIDTRTLPCDEKSLTWRSYTDKDEVVFAGAPLIVSTRETSFIDVRFARTPNTTYPYMAPCRDFSVCALWGQLSTPLPEPRSLSFTRCAFGGDHRMGVFTERVNPRSPQPLSVTMDHVLVDGASSSLLRSAPPLAFLTVDSGYNGEATLRNVSVHDLHRRFFSTGNGALSTVHVEDCAFRNNKGSLFDMYQQGEANIKFVSNVFAQHTGSIAGMTASAMVRGSVNIVFEDNSFSQNTIRYTDSGFTCTRRDATPISFEQTPQSKIFLRGNHIVDTQCFDTTSSEPRYVPMFGGLESAGSVSASDNVQQPDVDCPFGTGYRGNDTHSVFCTLCVVGFASNDASVCMPCKPGTSQPFTGRSACMPCAIGSAQSQWGSASCALCSPGTFSAASGATHCYVCPANTFQSGNGNGYCEQCSQGFCAQPGSTHCSPC